VKHRAISKRRVGAAWVMTVVLFSLVLAATTIGANAAASTPIPCPGGNVTLSDVSSPTLGFGVDDDVEIQLNGAQIFLNDDGIATNVGTPHFNVQTGDQLRLIAWNSPFFGNSHVIIGRLALHCDANGLQQVLDPNITEYATWPAGGVSNGRSVPGPNGTFYDRTFTILFTTGDTTTPTVTTGEPDDGAVYLLGQVAIANYSCSDEVGGSGVATCVGDVESGAEIDTSTVGPHTFTITSTDNAGNSTVVTLNYAVVYDFSGFFQPIDNLPTLNSVNAGRAIPVRFSLNGDQGLAIFATGYPKSQVIACDSTASVDGIEVTVAAGSSSLSYDADPDQYTYVWKTEKSWAGTCRQLVVKLIDDTSYRANFKFK